jgi:hypothetical protein
VGRFERVDFGGDGGDLFRGEGVSHHHEAIAIVLSDFPK